MTFWPSLGKNIEKKNTLKLSNYVLRWFLRSAEKIMLFVENWPAFLFYIHVCSEKLLINRQRKNLMYLISNICHLHPFASNLRSYSCFNCWFNFKQTWPFVLWNNIVPIIIGFEVGIELPSEIKVTICPSYQQKDKSIEMNRLL